MYRYIIILLLVLAFFSCKRDEYAPLDAEAQPLEYLEMHQLSEARWIDKCLVFDNKIFFLGGVGESIEGNGIKDNVDVYDLSTGSWSTSNLSQKKRVSEYVICDGKLFLIGGYTRTDMAMYMDIFDSSTHAWETFETGFPLGSVDAVVAGQKICLYNAETYEKNIPSSMLFDPVTHQMSFHFLKDSLYGVGATLVGENIYFAGGYKDNSGKGDLEFTKAIYIYNVDNQEWTHDSLSTARTYCKVFELNQKIYFAGGQYPYGMGINTVDVFDLISQTWSTNQLPEAGALISQFDTPDYSYFYLINSNYPEMHLISIQKNTGIWSMAQVPPLGSNDLLYTDDQYIVTQRTDTSFPCLDICRLSDMKWFVIKLNNSHPFPSKVVIAADKIFLAGGYTNKEVGGYNESVYSSEVNIFSLK